MSNPFLCIWTVLFQTIQFNISKWFQVLLCITNNSIYCQSFIYSWMSKQFSLAEVCKINVKTILFQTIQFSISIQFSSIWPIDRTLSGSATPGQREPKSDGNKGVLCIPQSYSITGTSPSDCLVSYPGHSLGDSYPLQRCSQCILPPLLTEPKENFSHNW